MDNHLGTSEKVIGLILAGKQSVNGFNADKFYGEYSKIFTDIKNGMSEPDLYHKWTNKIQVAKHAATSVNGLGTEMDWTSVLNTSYTNEIVGQYLDKAKRHAANGETDKLADMVRRINATINSSQRLRSVAADEIEEKYTPFLKSGTKSWDDHIGGFPNTGLVILAGKWGDGKTTSAILMMDNFLKLYPEKEILFVTLEDMAEGWKERAKIVLGPRSKEFLHRVKVMEFATSPDDIIEEGARYENVGMIYVDYVDYLAKNKSLEAYEEIYKCLALGSKSLAVNSKFRSMPIVALAQFGRGAYQGGVPTPAALMYTGEQYAYQLVMHYDPNKDFHADNENNPYTLPTVPGKAYFVVWKVKNGNRQHLDSPQGAILLPLARSGGINVCESGEWYPLGASEKREVKKSNRR